MRHKKRHGSLNVTKGLDNEKVKRSWKECCVIGMAQSHVASVIRLCRYTDCLQANLTATQKLELLNYKLHVSRRKIMSLRALLTIFSLLLYGMAQALPCLSFVSESAIEVLEPAVEAKYRWKVWLEILLL